MGRRYNFPMAGIGSLQQGDAMAPKYLMIDGMISRTGIRNAVEGGYLDPAALGLSPSFVAKLEAWLDRYHEAHCAGFIDEAALAPLDMEGIALAEHSARALPGTKVGYYSDAFAVRLKEPI